MAIRKLEKALRENDLYERYQSLLTEREAEIFSSYFAYDLSLSEIAEQRKISRAAVSESLAKTAEKLEKYEKALRLCALRADIQKKLAENVPPERILEDVLNGI